MVIQVQKTMKMKGGNKANLVDLVLCIIIFENHDFKINIKAETNTLVSDYFLFPMLCFYFLICFFGVIIHRISLLYAVWFV